MQHHIIRRFPSKSRVAFIHTKSNSTAHTQFELLGKYAVSERWQTVVQRFAPNGLDGLQIPDRRVVMVDKDSISVEFEDPEKARALIIGAGNGGRAQGSMQFTVAADHAEEKVAVKTNFFNCTAKLDGNKITFTALDTISWN